MEKVKKFRNYVLAFGVPFVICIIVLFMKDSLFDIENLFNSDLRVQHISFFSYFKNVLLGEASPFYSFSAGMGNSMLSTIIFYCISPFNLLLLFIKDIRVAIVFIYVLKVSLAGLTMYIFLSSKRDYAGVVAVLFSACYAVSSFVINYFFCVFWFDSLYLAPLVMLGIDKIFRNEKVNLLYIFCLALAIMCNIQMGFGLCVFSVIYFVYSYDINYGIRNIKNNWDNAKSLGSIFLVSSLCAGGISSAVLFGFLFDYANISVARSISVTSSAGVSNLGYILKNIFTVGNLKTDYYNNFEPYIYCGLVVTFFSILYLFDNDVEKRKRSSALGVILIFVVSFCVGFVNLFWHLSSPVLLNFRYSVYLELFLTMVAYEEYLTKKRFSKSDIIVMSVCLLVGLFMIVGYSNEVYVGVAFCFLILVYFSVLLAKVKNNKFEILLFGLVLVEVVANGCLSMYSASELPFGKYSSYDSFSKLASFNSFDDDYRVVYNYSYTDNTSDTLLLNRNSSLRYFSSVINGNVIKFFLKNSSVVGNNNYLVSGYDSPLLLSLLGVKHLYLTSQLNNSIYELIDSYEIDNFNYVNLKNETKDVYLYDNPYALSLGYVIDSDVKFKDGMDLVDFQNAIIKSFTGNKNDVMVRLDYTYNSDSEKCSYSDYYSCYTYDIKNNTNNSLVYVYGSFSRYTVSNKSKSYIDVNKPILISTLDNNILLTVENEGDVDPDDVIAVTYNKGVLVDSLSYLQENMISNVKISGNVLTGSIDSSKKGILFLSIPYDDNFKIYVDDELVDYYSVLDDTFVGLDISKGKHNIRVVYGNDNFWIYVGCSFLSLVVTLVLYYFINKNVDKKKEAMRIIYLKELENKKKREDKKKNNKSEIKRNSGKKGRSKKKKS